MRCLDYRSSNHQGEEQCNERHAIISGHSVAALCGKNSTGGCGDSLSRLNLLKVIRRRHVVATVGGGAVRVWECRVCN